MFITGNRFKISSWKEQGSEKTTAFVLLFLYIGLGSPALAALYEWEGEGRAVPMTDDLKKESPPGIGARKPQMIIASGDVDDQGHDREWWQKRVQEWERKKAEAQQQLARAQEEIKAIPLIPRTAERTEKKERLQTEIEISQAQIEEADRMLNEELPEEARKAGAPPGWLRE